MQAINILNLTSGFSIGYQYAVAKHKEDEIKQGKNYLLSSFCVMTQFGMLTNIANKIHNAAPNYKGKLAVKIAFNLTPILAYVGILFCGAVKQEVYDPFAKGWNTFAPKIPPANRFCKVLAKIRFPVNLSTTTKKLARLVANYAGSLIRVAVLTSAVTLIAMGNAAYGGALLAAVAYEALDSRGFVPRRISLFMEIYLPVLTSVGILLSGTIFSRMVAAVTLSTYVPLFKRLMQEKIDAFIHYKLPFMNQFDYLPTLKEINEPLKPPKELSYDEIKAILHAPSSKYIINVAHCSKQALNLDKLPSDNNFNKYLSLFDSIDWESKYNFVKSKLKDDDRFMDYLTEQYPGMTKQFLSSKIDNFIKNLAAKKGMSPEKFAANWARTQMESLISMLQGKKRVKGSQQDLDESIKLVKFILPHLTSLQNQKGTIDELLSNLVVGNDIEVKDLALKLKLKNYFNLEDPHGNKFFTLNDDDDDEIDLDKALLNLTSSNKIKIEIALAAIKTSNQTEFEDALLKLAVEGGDYCGRGIKRASNELLWGILESNDLQASQNTKGLDALESYEKKMMQALQNRRAKLVQKAYKETGATVTPILSDTHTFDLYNHCLTKGFFPKTIYEDNNSGLANLLWWELYHFKRKPMYALYHQELDSVVKEVGEIHFGLYMQQYINDHTGLTDDQKDELLDKYTSCNNNTWTTKETEERFHRLMFVKTQVLVEKKETQNDSNSKNNKNNPNNNSGVNINVNNNSIVT